MKSGRCDSSCSENHQSWNYKLVCISMRTELPWQLPMIWIFLTSCTLYLFTGLVFTLCWRGAHQHFSYTRSGYEAVGNVSSLTVVFSVKRPFNSPSEAIAESSLRAEYGLINQTSQCCCAAPSLPFPFLSFLSSPLVLEATFIADVVSNDTRTTIIKSQPEYSPQ